MKTTKNTIFLIALSIIFISCEPNDLTVNNINGPCESIEDAFYTTEQKFGDWKPIKLLRIEKTIYDKDGLIAEKTVINENGKISCQIKYHDLTPNEEANYSQQIQKMQSDYQNFYNSIYVSKSCIKPQSIGYYYDSLGQNTEIILITNDYKDEYKPLSMSYYFSKNKGDLLLSSCNARYIKSDEYNYPRVAVLLIDSSDTTWNYVEQKEMRAIDSKKDNIDNVADIKQTYKKIINPKFFYNEETKVDYSLNGFVIFDKMENCKEDKSRLINYRFLSFDKNDNWLEKVEIDLRYDSQDTLEEKIGKRISRYIKRKITYY